MIKKLIDLANEEIGYEVENENKYIEELSKIKKFYNKKLDESNASLAFVDWCMVQAFGVEKTKELVLQPNQELTTSCFFSEKYYKKNGQYFSIPRTGDQVFFKDDKKEIVHTGIVTKVDENNIYTVELEENVVCSKMYEKNYGGISGYGRPKYEELSKENVEETNESDKNDDNKDILLAPLSHDRSQAIKGENDNEIDN